MKKWYQSKTIWTNVAIVIAAIVQMLPQLQVTLTPDQYGALMFAFGAANIILRQLTSTAISK